MGFGPQRCSKPHFSLSKNPKLHLINGGQVFAKVDSQKTGVTYVTLIGWASSPAIQAWWLDRGKYFQINVQTLKEQDLLHGMSGFKASYLNTPAA